MINTATISQRIFLPVQYATLVRSFGSVRAVRIMFHHQSLAGEIFDVNSVYIWYLVVYKETQENYNSVEPQLCETPFANVPWK